MNIITFGTYIHIWTKKSNMDRYNALNCGQDFE